MTVTATCHCGGTKITLPEAPAHATRCTCTFCTKSGGLWAYYSPAAPVIISDKHGTVYSASRGINRHHFCANCGCQTYGISPAWTLEATDIPETERFAINTRLIDDFDMAGLVIDDIDGRNLW